MGNATFLPVFILFLVSACKVASPPPEAPPKGSLVPVASLMPNATSLLQQSHSSLPLPVNLKVTEHFHQFDDGSTIRWLESGATGGRTLILLHGATFRAELWKQLGTLKFFSLRGFRTISADLPRHGKTTNLPFSKSDYLQNLLKLTHSPNPILLGHSYAGSYMFPFLIEHPNTVSTVVWVAPTSIQEYQSRLHKIDTPSLIMWGENDEMISVAQASLLHRLLPNAQLHMLTDAMHECYQSKTEEFHNVIYKYLRRTAPDRYK